MCGASDATPFRHRKGKNSWYVDGDDNVTFFVDSDAPSSASANVSAVVDDRRARPPSFRVSASHQGTSRCGHLS
jgi:hypothetical protein